ncbi:nucleotide sugar dehydrogenase [Nitrosomonas sp. Is79A3]|uniref:nucleotide sugar dehydrogenase n=1 Tax=Nitrosomonas sp. (strain Is79A3) TaxID=261292 RepID=UPI000215D2B6
MRITIFGAGYVGLVQSAVLANAGHHVVCVDVDSDKVNKLNQGIVPIYEPGLEDLIRSNHAQERLQFTTDPKLGVLHGQIQFIAVGTPPDTSGNADVRYVLDAAKSIATYMEGYRCIVDKSTVPVGTADKVTGVVREVLASRKIQYEFDVVSNPEFLKEGAAVRDCERPDRIIIGTQQPRAIQLLREVFAPFNRNRDKIIVMNARSAELTKYVANCMLATRISFMNEMADLAERLGADIEEVRQGIGSDPRIGHHYIYPGAGYGGSCFPKDIQALIHSAESTGFDPKVLKAVEERNVAQKNVLYHKVSQFFDGNLEGKIIALWGLAFKHNTDDMREAPSRVLMEALWTAGAKVQAFDPKAMNKAQSIYGQRKDLKLTTTKEAALIGADVLIVVTEWQEFRAPDFGKIAAALRYPVIFDGRNLYNPNILAAHGIDYFSIGRASSKSCN